MQSADLPGREPVSEPVALPPGSVTRFNVAETGRTRRSTVWTALTAKYTDDVYVAAKPAGRFIKISLHKSGSWQHGFVIDEQAEGFRSPGQMRHFAIWRRPEEILPGWTRAIRIVIPDASLQARPAPGTPRKPVTDLLAIPGADAMIAEVWLESGDNTTPPPLRGAQLAGRLRQPGGGTVWVVGQRMTLPWDPSQHFSQMAAAARSEAIRQNPGWTGHPPLSICLHDPDAQNRELTLCELAVTALIWRKRLRALVPRGKSSSPEWTGPAGNGSFR